MAVFLLRFIVFSGILYFCYLLLFSKMSFFRLNRGFILSIPVFSLLIPGVAPYFETPAMAQPALKVLLQEIVIKTPLEERSPEIMNSLSWWWIIYGTGALISFISVLVGLFRGWRILKQSKRAFSNVWVTDETTGPFAFFKQIIVPSELLPNEKLPVVVAHEKAHVEQRHGYDNLFYNLLGILFWFNPFIYLLGRELRQVHECLADEAALSETSRESYAQLLLGSAFGSEISFATAHRFFNSSLIKNRITMMYKSKTNRKMRGLYLALLPLLMVMTVMSCQKTEQALEKTGVEAKSDVIGFAQADQPPLFEHCDASATHEEQVACFQKGIMTYVMENFKYPEKAREEKMEGKIYVQFVIDGSGKVTNVKADHWSFDGGKHSSGTPIKDPETGETSWEVKLNPAAREARDYAVQLVKGLPPVTPALKDGKKVPVSFTLPIVMKLN